MTIESEIAALTQATTDLLSAVNVRKATLDQKVADATTQADSSLSSAAASEASATASSNSAGQSAGSAAQALAIYGNTTVMQTAVAQAAAQASLAAGHAASASSVVQQDLSGVNAAALHRSPNAVTAMFVYDTSKDSDGGAWTEKCQHTSWYNEDINGKWLGAQASEAAARAVSGATTGDYFQLTTDGKFYKLNATSGTTEVFRGNKRDFPRLSAIVADGTSSGANRVVIYDLTEPGRPMWMAASANANNYNYYPFIPGVNGVLPTSIHAINSTVAIGFSGVADRYSYLRLEKFASDSMQTYSNGSNKVSSVGIAKRNTTEVGFPIEGAPAGSVAPGIVNGMVNSVAMTVLPDAPVDPVTGLKVPTIAVATNGGVSVIKHDGTVVSQLAHTVHVAFAEDTRLWAAGSDGGSYAVRLINKAFTSVEASFANIRYNIGAPYIAGNSVERPPQLRAAAGNAVYAVDPDTYKTVNILRSNNSKKVGSSVAYICETFNTGHQPGDIRRTYLADIDAGTVGNDIVTNGSFSGVADGTAVTTLAGWSAYSTPTNRDIQGEKLRITATAGSQGASLTVTTVVGKRYVFSVTATGDLGAAGIYSDVTGDVSTVSGNVRVVFTATATSTVFFFRAANNAAGTTYYDNISVQEVVADRSYKAQSASITGTLTKTPVALGSQLVAYSGFSA